eukprot:6228096-Prymnesium_polylepis.1
MPNPRSVVMGSWSLGTKKPSTARGSCSLCRALLRITSLYPEWKPGACHFAPLFACVSSSFLRSPGAHAIAGAARKPHPKSASETKERCGVVYVHTGNTRYTQKHRAGCGAPPEKPHHTLPFWSTTSSASQNSSEQPG